MILLVVRIIGALTNPFYKMIALVFSKRKSIPSITNPILVTSASELAKKIRTRELTCYEVVSAFIDRCKQVNPIINAIIQDRFDEALIDARKMDDLLRTEQMTAWQLRNEKPLLGIPVTIKEYCSVKGMMFSMGIKKHQNRIATRNSVAVQRLINAGAIPIAITSTPPRSFHLETFNDIIGYTSNPHDTRKTSGGSSGGEAALISCAGSVLGLGSDVGGSIRIPAAFCGIYGHKSTNDIVPSDGLSTFFRGQEFENMITVGPLCRYATDLELVMNVLSGNNLQKSNLRFQVNLKQLKIFYLLEYQQKGLSVNSVIKDKITEAATHFNTLYGCPVEQLVLLEFNDIIETTWTHFQRASAAMFKEGVRYTCSRDILKKQVSKIINKVPLSKVWKADKQFYINEMENLRLKLLKTLEDYGVILLPTWPYSASYKHQSIWKAYYTTYTYFANAFGLPSTAVPIGLDGDKMPVSIQVIAAPTQDRLCILVAKELENLFKGWIPPCELQLQSNYSKM